jgi:hypothetical protein
MILNTAEKSATAGKKATAGTSGVVTSRKFATLINTSRKFATRSLILVANHYIFRIFATSVIDTGGELAVATGINDTGGK